MSKIMQIFFLDKVAMGFIAVLVAASLVSGFLIIEANRLLASLFNEHVVANDPIGMFLSASTVAGLFILIFLIRLGCAYMQQKVQWEGVERFKKYFINKVLRAEAKFFYDKQAPDIWTSINLPSQNVAFFFVNIVSTITSIILLFFYAFIIFNIDVYAGIISFLAIPIYLLVVRTTGNKISKLQDKMMNLHRNLAVVSNEAIAGAANIKTKGAYDFFIQRMIKVVKELTITMQKVNVLMQYKSQVSGLISIIAPIFILFGAMQLSENINLNAGTAILLYINIPLLLSSFGGIFSGIISYKSSLPHFNKLKELQNIPLEHNGNVVIKHFDSLVTKGVMINYGDQKIVKVPDIEIKKGEKIIFAGESGVGKSSLFNVIIGFIQDYDGVVLVNGIDLRSIERESLRKVFGIVFQHTTVPTITLSENILLGAKKTKNEFMQILDEVSLLPLLEDKGDEVLRDQTISGGERARIGLAQSLALNPEVLLMDETFSNVDEDMETEIIKQLLKSQKNKTFICISHRMVNAGYFDRIVQF